MASVPNTDGRLAGLSALTTADVLTLLTPGFWKIANKIDMVTLRYTVTVAFLAFAHIGFWIQRQIKLTDWRPGGLDVLIVKRYGEVQSIPLTAELIFIVERYLAERPDCDCPYLLVSGTGKQPFVPTLTIAFRQLESRLGLKQSLSDMLLRFCAANLEKGKDPEAARRFLGYQNRHGTGDYRLLDISAERITRLVRRTNPFKTLAREISNEARAARYLATADVNIPMRRIVPPFSTPRQFVRLGPSDHPAIAELLQVDWPEDAVSRRRLRVQLRKRHLDAIDALLKDGRLDIKQAAEMFKTTVPLIHGWRNYFLRGGREWKRAYLARRPKRATKRRRRPNMHPEERAIVAELSAFAWSNDPTEAAAQRRILLERHYPTVCGMMTAKKIALSRAAELFGISVDVAGYLRAALKAGLPMHEANRENRYSRVPADCRLRLHHEFERREADETDRAFYFRMRRDHDFPGCEVMVGNFCRRMRKAKVARALAAKTIETGASAP